MPSFGADPDIVGSLDNIKLAEAKLKWNITLGTEESKKKWHNVAKDTLYNFAPSLDDDIKITQKNIEDTSELLNHPFEPTSYSFEMGKYRYAGEPPHALWNKNWKEGMVLMNMNFTYNYLSKIVSQ